VPLEESFAKHANHRLILKGMVTLAEGEGVAVACMHDSKCSWREWTRCVYS